MKENDFKYIDSYDVMKMLKISERTVYRMIKKGIIHAHRLPNTRKNYFDREEIQHILDQNIIDPNGKIDRIELIIHSKKSHP